MNDVLLARGCAKSTGYAVSYFSGATNVTPQAISSAGHATGSLLPQGISSIQLRVKVKSTAVKKKSCVIQVWSVGSPTVRDVVKVLLKPF